MIAERCCGGCSPEPEPTNNGEGVNGCAWRRGQSDKLEQTRPYGQAGHGGEPEDNNYDEVCMTDWNYFNKKFEPIVSLQCNTNK